jgi:alcohol dehydrogenase
MEKQKIVARSLLLVGPGQLEWVSAELPVPRPDEVLVATTAGAISIGSELPIYQGTARHSAPAFYPRMTGYESVGRVLACGEDIQHLQPGQRVLAFYGHRTHALVPATKVIAIPDALSDAISDGLALLAILTCDVSKGIRKLVPRPEEPVLVTGAGAIGLLTLFMLKALGIAQVDVIEPLVERRELALRLGARQAVPPEDKDSPSSTAGYPVAIECSSRNAAFHLLQEQMQQGGRVCILADGNQEPLVLAPAFHEKELLVVGSSDGWDYHQHAGWYFQHLQAHPTAAIALEAIFQVQTSADELAATFAALAAGTIRPTKVLVRYAANAQP